MRVVLVNYGHFAEQTEPEAVLDEFRTLTGWAEGLRDAGAGVRVVQGFTRDATVRRSGIAYDFVAGRFMPQLSRWRIPRRLHRVITARTPAPDVVHLNGLLYALQARHLRRQLPASCALAVQHHAARPDRGPAAAIQRWGLRAADGFIFTGREAAAAWRERGTIRPSQPVYEIVEGSTCFACGSRAAARSRTGFVGQPIFFWAANLDRNKDPLTVLAGFERALAELPEARLYMAYRSGELLPRVRQRLAGSAALGGAVERLGEVPYERMEDLFNSADFLLQGSSYEGSGYALVDALACGVVPVVTDIPTFRYMTGNGSVGTLWPPGDSAALAAAILEAVRRPLEPGRRAARAFFDENLSFEAIGRQARAAYSELHRRRRR